MALIRAPLDLVGPARYKARWYVDTETGALLSRNKAYSRALGMPHGQFTKQRRLEAMTGVLPAPPQARATASTSTARALKTREAHRKTRDAFATMWARQNGVSLRQALADPDFKGAWEMYKHSLKVKKTTMKTLANGKKIPYYSWLRRPMIEQVHAPKRWEEYGPGDTP